MFGQVGAVKATERPVNIVVLGDSLSAGFGLTVEDAFPAKLAAALKAKGAAVKVTNAGVSGDTASGGLGRLDWSVPDATDAVIVELGANDALRGLDPVLTKAALDTILNKLTARRISRLTCRDAGTAQHGCRLRTEPSMRFIRRLPRTRPVRIFYPFFLDGVAADPKLNQSDGLHPNVAGVDAIVVRIPAGGAKN